MKLDRIHDLLAGSARGGVTRDVPLARMTTYKLGGPAALLFEPATIEDLTLLGDVLAEVDPERDVPLFALGRGSNVVISDGGWPGIVVRIGPAWSWVGDAGDTGFRAGAGVSLPILANRAARRGLTGIEFGIAIPGSVGGAVRMNAGAHGGELSDHFVSARVFDLARREVLEPDAQALGLSYRHSNLTDEQVVLDATLKLGIEDPAAIKARMEELRRHRAATQPGAAQNAGSTFKNPPGDSAGRLVEAAGLKGFTIGGARVSEKHANFFIAGSGARAQDVFDLVQEVGERVAGHSGIELEPEVRFLGEFEPSSVGGVA